MSRDTTYRTLHDIGLAAWFGGTLFGVAALNAAAEEAPDQRTTRKVASVGWAKWAPVNAVGIAAHLVGAAGLLAENKNRVRTQRGVGATAGAKLALTGAALAATGYVRVLGKKIENAGIHDASDASSSSTSHASKQSTQAGGSGDAAQTAQKVDKVAGQAFGAATERLPLDLRQAERQMSYAQFALPVLTGAIIVLTSRAGEEQKPAEQLKGLVRQAGNAVGLAA